ncbi:MAG: VTT domain-containing protein [Planctomycetes bacterium]|nr:VTT domain-containing protein [Planctomycetota bacterium]
MMELQEVQQYVEDWGPLAVGFGSLLDNTGVPIFFVAGMAAAGALDIPREALFIAAVIGSIAGDMLVYVIGRYYLTKERILAGTFGEMFQPVINVGERAMQRWGLWSLLLGRFIPYVGKIIPLLAGSYQLSWVRTWIAVTAGSLLLMAVFYLYADTAIDLVKGESTAVKYVSIAIASAFLAVLWWLNHSLKKKSKKETEENNEQN